MDTKSKIRLFLEKETQRTIANDSENLISAGVLDSFSMIKLISFIKSELGVNVDMEALTAENFNSVDSITEMISRWK